MVLGYRPRAEHTQQEATIALCVPTNSRSPDISLLLNSVSITQKGIVLQKPMKKVWRLWRQEVKQRTASDVLLLPGSGTSLLIPVDITLGTVRLRVNGLVDTGAAIPLVIKKGLLPSSQLQNATWPVRFETASE